MEALLFLVVALLAWSGALALLFYRLGRRRGESAVFPGIWRPELAERDKEW